MFSPALVPARATMTIEPKTRLDRAGTLRRVPTDQTKDVRNAMSVISDPLRLPDEERAFVVDDERRRTPKTRRPRLYDAALPAATRLSGSPLRLPARVV